MIPRELQRSTPRNVEITTAGRFMILLGALLVIGAVAGGIGLYLNAGDTEQKAALRAKEGMTTGGVVVEAKRQKSDWRVKYTFEIAGRKLEGQTRARQKMEPGTTLEVGYLPSEPEDNWMVGHEPKPMSVWLSPLFALAQLVGVGLVVFKLRRDRDLLENGRAAEAVATETKRVSNGKTVSYRTRFEYRQPNGTVATGKLDSGKSIAVGTEFIIVYDPEKPKRLMQYPFTLYRIAD